MRGGEGSDSGGGGDVGQPDGRGTERVLRGQEGCPLCRKEGPGGHRPLPQAIGSAVKGRKTAPPGKHGCSEGGRQEECLLKGLRGGEDVAGAEQWPIESSDPRGHVFVVGRPTGASWPDPGILQQLVGVLRVCIRRFILQNWLQ